MNGPFCRFYSKFFDNFKIFVYFLYFSCFIQRYLILGCQPTRGSDRCFRLGTFSRFILFAFAIRLDAKAGGPLAYGCLPEHVLYDARKCDPSFAGVCGGLAARLVRCSSRSLGPSLPWVLTRARLVRCSQGRLAITRVWLVYLHVDIGQIRHRARLFGGVYIDVEKYTYSWTGLDTCVLRSRSLQQPVGWPAAPCLCVVLPFVVSKGVLTP